MKRVFVFLLVILLSGCSFSNPLKTKTADDYFIYKVHKTLFDNHNECNVHYYIDNDKKNTQSVSIPCENIISSTRSLLHLTHGPNNENVWVELTNYDYDNIVISDRRAFSDKEIKYIQSEMEKYGKECRIVKIEETDEKWLWTVFFKDGKEVDAPTVERQFSNWIIGEKSKVWKNDNTGEILVVLNKETNASLIASQED